MAKSNAENQKAWRERQKALVKGVGGESGLQDVKKELEELKKEVYDLRSKLNQLMQSGVPDKHQVWLEKEQFRRDAWLERREIRRLEKEKVASEKELKRVEKQQLMGEGGAKRIELEHASWLEKQKVRDQRRNEKAQLAEMAKLERLHLREERCERVRVEKEERKRLREEKKATKQPKFYVLNVNKINKDVIKRFAEFGTFRFQFYTLWGDTLRILHPHHCFDSEGNKWVSIDQLLKQCQKECSTQVDEFILNQLLPAVYKNQRCYRFGEVSRPSIRPLGCWRPEDTDIPLEWVTPDLFLKVWDHLHKLTGKGVPASVIEGYIRMTHQDLSLYPTFESGCDPMKSVNKWRDGLYESR